MGRYLALLIGVAAEPLRDVPDLRPGIVIGVIAVADLAIDPRLDAETKISGLVVEAGESLDFIVDCRADNNSDSFSWAPSIRMGEEEWPAQSSFGGPAPKPPPPMSAGEKYVHVLLESNEFIFVD